MIWVKVGRVTLVLPRLNMACVQLRSDAVVMADDKVWLAPADQFHDSELIEATIKNISSADPKMADVLVRTGAMKASIGWHVVKHQHMVLDDTGLRRTKAAQSAMDKLP